MIEKTFLLCTLTSATVNEIKTVHIRKLRFEEARRKLLAEIESAFVNGVSLLEVVHGVGTYTLRRMVETEVEKLDYVRVRDNDFNANPGTLKLEILLPEQNILKEYF